MKNKNTTTGTRKGNFAVAQKKIEEALGAALCTAANPCGAVVNHFAGEGWVISDDHYHESFPTVASAIAAAKTWLD